MNISDSFNAGFNQVLHQQDQAVTSPDGKKPRKWAIIIGCIVGGVVLVAATVTGAIFLKKHLDNQKKLKQITQDQDFAKKLVAKDCSETAKQLVQDRHLAARLAWEEAQQNPEAR